MPKTAFSLHRAQRDGGARARPKDMPEHVPPTQPAVAPKARDVLPEQKPIDDAPTARAPARWKSALRLGLIGLLIVTLLAALYVFLLIGEPSEDDQLKNQTAQEEPIRVPMAAVEADGGSLNNLAANFGLPVLALYGDLLTLEKATLYDTAFEGAYARRVTLSYAFSDGTLLKVESLRPTGAVTLLRSSGFQLNAQSLYTIAGVDALRIDGADELRVIAQGTNAVYAVACPLSHEADLAAVLKQTTLLQPGT